MIISAGNQETFPFADAMGVGLTAMSINLTRAVLYTKPEYLLFVGSAGSYGEFKIGDIVESTTASNIEFSFWDKSSYTPIDNVIDAGQNTMIKSQTIINSSNYITTNPKYNPNYLSNNIGLENMEFYAVLEVAKEFELPVGGIFVVTNSVGECAHEEFIANHNDAMAKLTSYLKQRQIIN
jgi:nucleoside phosphorylase